MQEIAMQDMNNTLITITKQLLQESGETTSREITVQASLQRHLGIDSLMRAELFKRIEKAFHTPLPDALLMKAETLQDLADYLRVHLNDPASAETVIKKETFSIATPHTALTIDPSAAISLIDVLQRYADNMPQKTHIYFQQEEGREVIITYGELFEKASRVAHGLQLLDLKEGETVAIMLPTQPEFFYCFFGILLAGGIPVPIYPPFRMHMLESYAKTESVILGNAQVRILITFPEALSLSRLLQGFVPSLKHVTQVEPLLQASPVARTQAFSAESHHFAFIQYTSGSTANPKGVLLTHANLLANIRGYGKAIAVRSDDVAVSWLPLYHDMGLIGMWLGSLYYGIPLVLLTPFSFLNHPERWLWAIHHYRGTLSGAPNFAYELCVRKIDAALLEGLDLSSWRMAANGAEKVYPATLQQFADTFARYGFNRRALLPVYGLAESTVGLAIPPQGQDFQIDYVERYAFEAAREAKPAPQNAPDALAFVNCGVPLEGHAIRIVNDEGQPLPSRHVGRIQFQGPSSMQGYFKNPAATAAIYHDGWWDTGDLGYQAEGALYVTGRFKDLIIKAGRNLYPAEIEEIVGHIGGVRQGCVAAFGVSQDARGTEQLVVVAETREKNKAKLAAIKAAIQDQLGTVLDLVPDDIVLVPPHRVPKTSSGKLQRAACKQKYAAGTLKGRLTPPWLQVVKIALLSGARKGKALLAWVGKACYTTYVALLTFITLWPVYLCIRLSTPNTALTITRRWLKFLIAAAFCSVRVVNKEKMITETAAVYVANHASYLDAVVVVSSMPTMLHMVAKKELFHVPILRTFLKRLGCVSVDRTDLPKGIADTKYIESLLAQGQSVLIFPEGTFGYAAGLRPFRLGAFKIAVDAAKPVCPLSIAGTRQLLRDDERLMRPGRIVVTVCDAFHAASNEWQDIATLRNQVRDAIAQHCGEPSLDFIVPQTVAARRQ